MTNTNWEVGAFCGDECRGLGDADNWWVSPEDYSDLLEIVVGGATGDVINFYLYDVTNQEVYPAICAVTLDWIDDDIGDMFEPFVLNFETSRTFTKDITGYTEGSNDHYYLIASPIGEVKPENVTNMLSNNYDLYYFDQAQGLEWINYKSDDGNYNLISGKGYLYANSEDVTLTFTGFPYSGDGEVTLNYDADDNFPGWNLVGNPFAHTAYITKDFYKLNTEGSDFVTATAETAIEAMEGVFVIAEEDGEILTFSTTAPDKSANLVMNITQNRGIVIDRAIVRFGEGRQLPKFQLNPNNTKVYIPQDGNDYAVVCASEMGEMPVSFKAENDGTYTLSFSSEEVSFNYLHLIDNMTGNDINLLALRPHSTGSGTEGSVASYTFNANVTDYESRFKLVFAVGPSTGSGAFAFIDAAGNIIVNGEGTLQVIDMMGRVVLSGDAMNRVSTSGMTPGVYVLRLINGEDVRTQKIVVR